MKEIGDLMLDNKVSRPLCGEDCLEVFIGHGSDIGLINKTDAGQIIKHLQEVFDIGLSDDAMKEVVIDYIDSIADYNNEYHHESWSPELLLTNRDLSESALKAVDYLNLTAEDFK